MKQKFISLLLASVAALASISNASAAEYQWSTSGDPVTSMENINPRAFLWIPPICQLVRAVVVGQHNQSDLAGDVAGLRIAPIGSA